MKGRRTGLSRKAFVAVRRSMDDEGFQDWICLSSMSFDRETARRNARAVDQQAPAWAKANPIVRVAQVWIDEVEP